MPRELAQLLLDEGVVAPDDVERALARQRELGGALDTALLELGLVDELQLTGLLSRASDLPPAPLSAYESVDPRARRVFPSKVAERHGLAPFALDGRELSLVATCPLDLGLLDEISFMLSLHLTPHVGPEWRVRGLIHRLYGGAVSPRLARLAGTAGGPIEEAAATPRPAPAPTPPPPAQRPHPQRPPGFTGFRGASDEPLEPLAAALAQAAEAFELDWEAEALATPLPGVAPSTREAPAPEAGAAQQEAEPPTATATGAEAEAPAPAEEPALAELDRSAPPRWTVARARAALDAARSRDEIVLCALRYARDFFQYAALFAVTRDAVAGHDALGPEDGTREVARTVALYVSDPGIFRTTLDTLAPYLGPVGRDAAGSVAVLDGLARGSPRTALVYPVLLRGRPIAILYADNGQAPVSARRLGDLLLVLSLVGGAFERIIKARKQPRGAAPRPPAPPPPVALPAAPEAPTAPEAPAVAVEAPPAAEIAAPAPEPEVAAPVDWSAPAAPLEAAPAEAPPAWSAEPAAWTEAPEVAPPEPSAWSAPAEPSRADAPPPPQAPVEAEVPPEIAAAFPEPSALPPEPAAPAPAPDLADVEEAFFSSAPTAPAGPAPAASAPSPPLEIPVPLELTGERPLAPAPAAPEEVPPEIAAAYGTPASPEPERAAQAEQAEPPLDPATLVGAYLTSPRAGDDRARLLALMVERAAVVAPILCDQLPGPIEVPSEALAATPAAAQGPVLAAVAALGPAALQPLLAMLADPAPSRRRAAVALLGQLGDPAAFLPLAERCFDHHAAVAEAARAALALHRRDPAMKPVPEKLRRALLSGLTDKAGAAARAIAALRDAESIPLLIQALEGSDAGTAGAAAEALSAITLQRHGTRARDWLMWWKQNRGRARADWLFGALTAGDRELRVQAATELREAAASPVSYSADLPEAERLAAAQAWQAWFQKGGHRP